MATQQELLAKIRDLEIQRAKAAELSLGKKEREFLDGLFIQLNRIKERLTVIVTSLKHGEDNSLRTGENIDKIGRAIDSLRPTFAKILASGDKYFSTIGDDIESRVFQSLDDKMKNFRELGVPVQKEFRFISGPKEGKKENIDDFLVVSEELKRFASTRALGYWDKAFKGFQGEVKQALLDQVIGGMTQQQVIEQLALKIPTVGKPDKNGVPRKIDPYARAAVIVSNETIRMYNDFNQAMAKEAFGPEAYVENINPMDESTCGPDVCDCWGLTMRGVIPVSEMERLAECGPPPRHVNCRCQYVYYPPKVARAAEKEHMEEISRRRQEDPELFESRND